MPEIVFQKFTSYGNNFVIVDETKNRQLQEEEKSRFACQVTDVNFGIGADGVLFLQPYRSDVLAEINAYRSYWDRLPVFPKLDIMFRIFEPNGVESYSCGNGLMCLASYLNRQYNIASTKILTQLPTRRPRVVTIGTDSKKSTNWAIMGSPERIPRGIVNHPNSTPLGNDIDIINYISISFRAGDLDPFSNETDLALTGFLVYTGEPHLVIFPESGFSINELKKVLFIASHQDLSATDPPERRITFGSWLINHIGMSLNKHYAHIFPNGINVNFVHIPVKDHVLEYRCFERGINKETLACGTGALAVSFVAQHMNMISDKQITVWPHRSRWYDPEAFILIDQDKNQWSLCGNPIMLLEGKFMMEKLLSEKVAAAKSQNSGHNQRCHLQEEIPHHATSINY